MDRVNKFLRKKIMSTIAIGMGQTMSNAVLDAFPKFVSFRCPKKRATGTCLGTIDT